jgi:hypothetical protein
VGDAARPDPRAPGFWEILGQLLRNSLEGLALATLLQWLNRTTMRSALQMALVLWAGFRLTAFDLGQDGSLTNRRVWADICALGGDDGRTLFLCVTKDFRLMPDEAASTRPSSVLAVRL